MPARLRYYVLRFSNPQAEMPSKLRAEDLMLKLQCLVIKLLPRKRVLRVRAGCSKKQELGSVLFALHVSTASFTAEKCEHVNIDFHD